MKPSIHYVGRRTDELAFGALGVMCHLSTSRYLEGHEHLMPLLDEPDTLFVALFTSPGRYPSRHYRIVQPRDIEARKMQVPVWVPPLGHFGPMRLVHVALNLPQHRDAESVTRSQSFKQSMTDLHRRIAGSEKLGLELSRKKKLRSDSLSRRREEFRRTPARIGNQI